MSASAVVARPRRARVRPRWGTESPEDVRTRLKSAGWRGLPNSFVGNLVWICKGLAEVQILMLVESMTSGAGFDGRKGEKPPEWTEPLAPADFAKASPFSETMMLAGIERLVGIGAIRRKCGCGEGESCSNANHDHYRFRNSTEKWHNIPSAHQPPADAQGPKSEAKANTQPSTLCRVEPGKAVRFGRGRYEMPEAIPVKAVDYDCAEGASDDIVARLDDQGILRVTQRPAMSKAKPTAVSPPTPAPRESLIDALASRNFAIAPDFADTILKNMGAAPLDWFLSTLDEKIENARAKRAGYRTAWLPQTARDAAGSWPVERARREKEGVRSEERPSASEASAKRTAKAVLADPNASSEERQFARDILGSL